MIKRGLESNIIDQLTAEKIVFIVGSRQTGKTNFIAGIFGDKTVRLDASEQDVKELFNSESPAHFKVLFREYTTVIIDEAHRIENAAVKIKAVAEEIPDKRLVIISPVSILSGSAHMDNTNSKTKEYILYPLAYSEMADHHGIITERQLLEYRMIYGYYPEVVNNPGKEKEILKKITENYLYRDILMWQNLKKPEKLIKLLQILAKKLGEEISYNELAKVVGLDNETVDKYIRMLENAYILFRLDAFGGILKKEIKLSRKVFFYDNGIRNALIANFNQLTIRQDEEVLWENFVISERQKYLHYNDITLRNFFWRTHDMQNINYIEERENKLFACKIKWNYSKREYISKTFSKAYPDADNHIITKDNFMEYVY